MLAGHLVQDVAKRPSRLRDDAQRARDRIGDQLRAHRCQVGEPGAVRKRVGVRGGDAQGEPGLAHTSRPGEGDQAMGVDQGGQLVQLAVSANEARQRHGQVGVAAGGPAQLHPQVGECRPIGGAELVQECGNVALHGSYGDVQALGDLAIAQPLGYGGEHFGLARCYAGAHQSLRYHRAGAAHTGIVHGRTASAVRRSTSVGRPVDRTDELSAARTQALANDNRFHRRSLMGP